MMKDPTICAHADIRPEHYLYTRDRRENRMRRDCAAPLLKEAEPRASWCQIAVYAFAAFALAVVVLSARGCAYCLAMGAF